MKHLLKNFLLTVLYIFVTNLCFGAENYKVGDKLFVAPTAGVNMRVFPSITAPIQIKLTYNTVVTVVPNSLSRTPFQVEVSDLYSGKLQLQGHWVKVKAGNMSGYIFDGMLSKFKGLGLQNMDDDSYYFSLFGKPKKEVLRKSTVIKGRKLPYKTQITTYPKVLIMESTLFDDCFEEKYTFTTSFNEAYWLMVRMMVYADAAQDVKITKSAKGAVLSFYSCT